MPEPHILELSMETAGAVLQVLVGESLRETYTGNVIGTGVVTISMPVVNAYAGQALFGVIADQYGRVIGGTSENSVILNQIGTNQEASYKIAGFGELGLYLGINPLTAPLVDTTNKLYNIGGELYWNGSNVNQSPFSGLRTTGVVIATSPTTVSSSDALMFEDGTLTMKAGIIITAFSSNVIHIGYYAGEDSTNNTDCAMFGVAAGYQTSNNYMCMFLGYSAGTLVTNTINATFVGSNAGQNCNGANYTVFLGANVGAASSATYSLFVGYDSGDNSSGIDVYAIGKQSARNMASGTHVVALGVSAGDSCTGPQFTTLIGTIAGAGASNIQYVQFIGYSAGANASSLQNSEGYGEYALSSSYGIISSSAYGGHCGQNATSWSYVSAVGFYAGQRSAQISESIMLGYNAGQDTLTFSGCVSLGKQASQYAQKQTDCIHIGSYTGANSSYGEYVASSSNNIFIGTDAGGSQSSAPCGGNHNIYIGRRAGSSLGIGDGRLVITPHDRGATDVTALIYGQDNLSSENSVLNLNAVVTARHGVVLPQYSEANTASTVDTLYNVSIDGASVLFWNGFEVAGRKTPDLRLGLTWVMTGLSSSYTPRCCVTSADGSYLFVISTESGSSIRYTTDGIVWLEGPTFGYTGSIVDVIYSSRLSLYIAVQATGSSYIYTSADIGFWSKQNIPNDCYQNRFVVEDTFHEVVFIAGAYGLASSVDTVTWTNIYNDPLNFSVNGLAYDPINHVVGFIQKTDATGYYFRSTSDGGATFTTPVFVHNGASSAGLYYAPLSRTWYCYASGSIRYSKDNGETWTSSLGVSSENWFTIIETDVGNVVAVAHQNTTTRGLCKTINDGYNFSNYNLPFGSSISDIDFIKLAKLPNGRFIMLSQTGAIRSAITV